MVVSVNPFKPMDTLYSDEVIFEYMDNDPDLLPPHLFTVANKAYFHLRTVEVPQSVIITGKK
jgi:myosin heavy subunit